MDDARDRHPSAHRRPALPRPVEHPCRVHGPASLPPPEVPRRDVIVIDCDECARQGSSACDDCVVTYLCDRPPDVPVVVDIVTERAVRLLGEVGLVPTLKHLRCVSSSADVGR